MIIPNNYEEIESFKNYLGEKLNQIDNLSSKDSKLFKKILYVSFLDSLSACVYPNRGNKDRFIALIDRFSKWEERNNICLLHLAKFTSINSDPALEKIRIYSQQEITSWLSKNNGKGAILVSELPDCDLVRENWSPPCKDSKIEFKLDDFKHVSLLYMLRNSLVHQFQSKGVEIGESIPDEPFYQVVCSVGEENKFIPKSIELIYPTKFLKSLCHNTLNTVIEYFANGNINPFPHYYTGDYWLQSLNR